EPELHSKLVNPIRQRTKSVGPRDGVDGPITEARRIVTAAKEPPIVEHETLDTDAGRAHCEAIELGRVVVEVDGLPCVESERPRGSRMLRPGAKPRVHALGDPVESRIGEDERYGRRRILVTTTEHDLARA